MATPPSAIDPIRSPFPPLQPNELAKESEKFEWNPHIPLRYYVGALDALYREGRNYLRERNFAKAYLLLLRFSILYLDKLLTVPEAQTPEGRRLLKPTRGRINEVLVELERIKPDLIEARDRWESEHVAATTKPANERDTAASRFASRDAALSWNAKAQAKILDASENQDLAVDLATSELRRRDVARRTMDEPIILGDGKKQGTAEEGYENWGRTVSVSAQDTDGTEGDNRHRMEEARRRLNERDSNFQIAVEHGSENASFSGASAYHYPSISKTTPLQYHTSPTSQDVSASASIAPPRPPRQLPFGSPLYREVAPPIPPRSGVPASYDRKQQPGTTELPPQPPPKTLEPSTPNKEQYTFRPAAYLEDGKPIRPIFVPENLRQEFVRLAARNTTKGIETCGILCGTNINNALFITCLLVPEQHGTPDTCETTNEAATFEFFEKEDLLQIGWIHTHPTQTCFMSSRDLHTQAGYQIMMDESIAIVCAPNHDPSWGIFRLTKPPGLQHLLDCDRTDTFHQHSLPADALYTNALNPPGHVFVSSKMAYQIHDMRP